MKWERFGGSFQVKAAFPGTYKDGETANKTEEERKSG